MKLLIAILLLPIIEIYLFIQVGSRIGAFTTIVITFLTAFIGYLSIKYAGLNSIYGFGSKSLQINVEELLSLPLVFISGILLFIPGFFTDFLGIMIVFPPIRSLIFRKFLIKYSKKRSNKDRDYIDEQK